MNCFLFVLPLFFSPVSSFAFLFFCYGRPPRHAWVARTCVRASRAIGRSVIMGSGWGSMSNWSEKSWHGSVADILDWVMAPAVLHRELEWDVLLILSHSCWLQNLFRLASSVICMKLLHWQWIMGHCTFQLWCPNLWASSFFSYLGEFMVFFFLQLLRWYTGTGTLRSYCKCTEFIHSRYRAFLSREVLHSVTIAVL